MQIVVRDGNYLLNLGPTEEGIFDRDQATRIRQVGEWLTEYGDTIYNTRGGPVLPGEWGGATYRDHTIYLHILEWKEDKLKLFLCEGEVESYRNRTGKEVIFNQDDREIVIQVPISERNLYDTIIELELKAPVQWGGAVVNSESKYGLGDGL